MLCKICGNEIENEDEEIEGVCEDCQLELREIARI